MTVLICSIVSGEFSEFEDGSISMWLMIIFFFVRTTLLTSLAKTYVRVGDTLILKEMPVLEIGLF